MDRRAIAVLVAMCLLLTGCASLLDREYSVSSPHTSRFWESEAADTLRAENYQDIVNDLLLLIAQHSETATLRLYDFTDDLSVSRDMEAAAVEIQQETPLGAYAVDYITFSSQAQRSYYEVSLGIHYRRSAEQVQSVRNATSASAVYTLLDTALTEGQRELTLRIAYWSENSLSIVEDAVTQLRSTRGIPDSSVWVIHYYPQPFSGSVAMIEFLLQPTQAEILEYLASLPLSEPEEPAEPQIPQTSAETGGGEPQAVTAADPVPPAEPPAPETGTVPAPESPPDPAAEPEDVPAEPSPGDDPGPASPPEEAPAAAADAPVDPPTP